LEEFGVSVEFGVELVNFVQDEAGIDITLKHTADQTEEMVKVKYIIGADGGRGEFLIMAGGSAPVSPVHRGDTQAGRRSFFRRV
jgi:2-polyprenyl-6-methoxyphenol hydroxylase-like FAD-dependent oxidoreductase